MSGWCIRLSLIALLAGCGGLEGIVPQVPDDGGTGNGDDAGPCYQTPELACSAYGACGLFVVVDCGHRTHFVCPTCSEDGGPVIDAGVGVAVGDAGPTALDAGLRDGGASLHCAPGLDVCNGVCTATHIGDETNCGACGRICPTGSTCLSDECVCSAGQAVCNGACASVMTDALNCGGCGVTCGGVGQRCAGGECVCQDGLVQVVSGETCGGQTVMGCVPPTCGAIVSTGERPCGIGAEGPYCRLGLTATNYDHCYRCLCPISGQINCGNSPGTCIDIHHDPQNCGSCGHACGAGQICEETSPGASSVHCVH